MDDHRELVLTAIVEYVVALDEARYRFEQKLEAVDGGYRVRLSEITEWVHS